MKFNFAYADDNDGGGERVKNALFGNRGRDLIMVLSQSENEPKDQLSAATKTSKILFENFIRRPSLKDEAIRQLSAFMNDGILAMQTPQYKVFCSSAALMICGERFRFLASGSIRAFHFINGQISLAYPSQPAPKLGEGVTAACSTSPETAFTKGEHSFLLAAPDVVRLISAEEFEQTLARATSAEHWVDLIRALFQQRCKPGEVFSVCALLMPNKKERPSRKKTILILAALVIVALLIFFGLGALRRSSQPEPNAGPGQYGQMQQPPAPTQPPQPQP